VVDPVLDGETRLEGCVEDRRRRLADAAADRGDEDAPEDHLAFAEAALGSPGADLRVVRERLAGLDDRPVHVVAEEVDVPDAIRRRLTHVCREGGDPFADAERLRILGREVRGERRQPQDGDAPTGRATSREHGLGRLLDVEGRARLGPDDPDPLADDLERRIDGLAKPRLDHRQQGAPEPFGIERERPGPPGALEADQLGELRRAELADASLPETNRDRRPDERAGPTRDRLGLLRRDGGLHRLERRRDVGRAGETGGPHGGEHGVDGDCRPQRARLDDDVGTAHAQARVHRPLRQPRESRRHLRAPGRTELQHRLDLPLEGKGHDGS
jgi:hypothetical protein